jgi:hypothetical protein
LYVWGARQHWVLLSISPDHNRVFQKKNRAMKGIIRYLSFRRKRREKREKRAEISTWLPIYQVI